MSREKLLTGTARISPIISLYSHVRLHFKDKRPSVEGVLTGVASVVELDRTQMYNHEDIARVDLLKRHNEVL